MSNISKKHREDLLDKIQQIRTFIASAPQDANTNNLLQYLDELTKDVKGKKYGLVFEQHREQIDEILDTHTPVLTEQKDLFIDNGGEMNFLIEGDNLAALQLLEKTHKGKIDVIYIDPPYNTGAKDWKYNNDYVDGNDTFRHSKWLSWLRNRIVVARNLLTEKGIMAVTIDDYEIAALRLTMDELFGIDNYLGTIVIRNNPSGRSTVRGLSINHEYALLYSKTPTAVLGFMKHNEKQKSRYDEIDSKGNYEWENFRKNGTDSDRKDRPKQFFPIVINNNTLKLHIPEIKWDDAARSYVVSGVIKDDETVVYPITKGIEKVWKYGLERTVSILDEIRVKKTKVGFELYRKKYLNAEGSLPRTWWDKPEYSARDNGTRALTNIFGSQKVFDFPKAPEAVKDVLVASNLRKNGITLDFFAGSGTTGHAVMKLNAEDDGHRKFILCTNNENNICRDVTYERLKTVITGKRKDGSEYNEHYDASLKYYKIDFVPISDKLYYEYADKLLLHIRELVELENGINFNGNNDIAIVLTDEEMEQFVAYDNQAKVLYRGHDVLLTAEQENYIKANGIKVNVIPDYYYNELNQ